MQCVISLNYWRKLQWCKWVWLSYSVERGPRITRSVFRAPDDRVITALQCTGKPLRGLRLPKKSVCRFTDCFDMILIVLTWSLNSKTAKIHSAIGSVFDCRSRNHKFESHYSHILSTIILPLLIHEGQLSV